MQRIFGLAQRGVDEEKSEDCSAVLKAQLDELALLFDEAQSDWYLKEAEWKGQYEAGAFTFITFTFTFIEARSFHIHVLEHFAFIHSLEDLKKENDSYKEQAAKHDSEKAQLIDLASKTNEELEKEKKSLADKWWAEKNNMKAQAAEKLMENTKSWEERLAAEKKTWEDKLAEDMAKLQAHSAHSAAESQSAADSHSAGQHIHISQSQQLDTHSKFT